MSSASNNKQPKRLQVDPNTPPQKSSRRRTQDPLPCHDPTAETLATLAQYNPPPRPVPNLGYACLCMELRELKPTPVFTSRDCVKKTFESKGLPYIGELCLANIKDLARVIQWNQEHGIRFFRISSVLCPWMGNSYNFEDLPQYNKISQALKFCGDLSRAYDQRLTFHPSHFVKLAAPDSNAELVNKSLAELEAHSKIFDMMGFAPSPVNKINIHIGGVYADSGSKEDTMRRWAENFRRLSENARARITVENDDKESAFSIQDLLKLHEMCGVPLVFDFHHHKFCPGEMTEEEAFRAAIATWPAGVRPVVHWSESQAGRRPHAHSDYIKGPIRLHGCDGEVDVMIESKAKEKALLAYRDGLPIPDVVVDGDAA